MYIIYYINIKHNSLLLIKVMWNSILQDKHYYSDLYINLSVYPFVSNKRQNGWTDRAQIFCGTSHDPRDGLWMVKFSKICLHQNSFFENFENPRNFFLKIRNIFCFYYLLTRRTPVYFILNKKILQLK